MALVVFENPGEIDPRLISTFGVNVKEGDNPIGFFGTGLKYAIAVLLRTGHRVTVQAGLDTYEFDLAPTTIRNKTFEVVRMTGKGETTPLGFTTELGKTWELWAAYRELFCNARDENGEAYTAREAPPPVAGKTRVIVAGQDFAAIHANRDQYFLEDDADLVLDTIEIRRRPSRAYFYRGVRVSDLIRPAMFTYNDTQALALTEDRTVKHGYEVVFRLARAFLKCADDRILRQVLTAPEETFEGGLDYHGWGVKAGPIFLRVVGELVQDRVAQINATALRVWREEAGSLIAPRKIDLTAVQQRTLDRALDFAGKIGFPIRGSYPISVVESLGAETLGMAVDKTILISERAFHMGTKTVAGTLIEEYVHLKHGYHDMTRQMQNFLFDKMVSLGEELTGEPL